jgi:hypothetical protein
MWEECVAAQLDGKNCSGIRLQRLGRSTQTLSHNTNTVGEIWTQALHSTNQSYYLHLTACSHVLSGLKFAIYGHAVVLRCCVTYRGLHRKCHECQWRVMIETQFQPDIFPGGRGKKNTKPFVKITRFPAVVLTSTLLTRYPVCICVFF